MTDSQAIQLPSDESAVESPRLQIEDALASARRLWLRGRLLPPVHQSPSKPPSPWWTRWWNRSERAPAPAVHLETRIGGQVFDADPQLQADGRFEALFTTELPSARRGWRMTRNRL